MENYQNNSPLLNSKNTNCFSIYTNFQSPKKKRFSKRHKRAFSASDFLKSKQTIEIRDKNQAEGNVKFELQHLKCTFFLLLSIFFYSFFILFVKVIMNNEYITHLSNNSITFFCGVFMMFFSIFSMKKDNIDLNNIKNFNKNEVDYLIIRAMTGFLSLYFTIIALNNMRLVSCITTIMLSPVFTTFFVIKQKKEKMNIKDKFILLFSLLVIMLSIIQDFSLSRHRLEFNSDIVTGSLSGFLAAVINSVNNLIDIKVSDEFHSYTVLFLTGVITLMFTPLLMFFAGHIIKIEISQFLFFLLIAASWFFYFYFSYKSIQSNSHLINSPLNFITIGLCYVFSFVILDEKFSIYDLIASFFIIVINFYTSLRIEDCENEDYY